MKIAIYGYGNLGKGVEIALNRNEDMELTGIYTRRDPSSLCSLSGAPVFSAEEIDKHQKDIDVLIVCGGSATDLPVMTPALASRFSMVDSFDTHACIPEHFDAADAAAKKAGTLCMISAGWDPGLFSLARLYFGSILPDGADYTFWGRGVSQGHSDVIRRIEGVADARQYTVPKEDALNRVRSGETPSLTARDKHLRECYVVAKPGADLVKIEKTIKEMPHYFADYDTTVTFVTQDELDRNHRELPHGGFVIRNGKTGSHVQTAELRLALESNPEFTGSVLVACARAVFRMKERGRTGCITLADVAPADLSPLSPEEIRQRIL